MYIPWLFLEWLHILDLHNKDVSRLSGFDFEGTGQVVYLRQVDILHVVCAIVVLNLATRPIDTFNLDNLPISDFASEGDCKKHKSMAGDKARRWVRARRQGATYSTT